MKYNGLSVSHEPIAVMDKKIDNRNTSTPLEQMLVINDEGLVLVDFIFILIYTKEDQNWILIILL